MKPEIFGFGRSSLRNSSVIERETFLPQGMNIKDEKRVSFVDLTCFTSVKFNLSGWAGLSVRFRRSS